MNDPLNNPAVWGYIDAVLHDPFMEEENFTFLSLQEVSTKTLEISFKGWLPIKIDIQDSSFNKLLILCRENIRKIKEEYKDKFSFFPPQLIWEANSEIVVVKIRMREKETNEKKKLSKK